MNNCQDIENELVVGIDLGTTNSCISIWRNNNLEIIPDEKGNNTIPSVVAFTNRTRYIGHDANNQRELNPKNVFYEVKRLIGRQLTDETVLNEAEFLTYTLTCKCNGNINNEDCKNGCNILIKPDLKTNKKYTPEEISAIILSQLKNNASKYLNQDITKAVITVPAYFNDSQRQSTKDAASIAGLDCVRIINEPTAASLAYGLTKLDKTKEHTVIVYDFGGGTLDVSLLKIDDGIFEVLASSGNTHLGGLDFDNRIIDYCLHNFKEKFNIQEFNELSALSMQKLKKESELSKKKLSQIDIDTCDIIINNFYDNKKLQITITRNIINEICNDLLILCMKPIYDVLKSCELPITDINDIILVGGMTRMPIIQNNISMFFNNKKLNCSINPDEVVAMGAAIQGYILSHKNDPFSESVTLLDIIPLSLGVETIGGIMDIIIPRNSIIPISCDKLYTTDSDFQQSVIIKIFEGERSLTTDNFKVGEFILSNLQSAPRGHAEIKVTFNVDVNGIITISALDIKNTNNYETIIISGHKNRLSNSEIEHLIEEAKEQEKNDLLQKDKKKLYFEINNLCNNIKLNVSDKNNLDLKDTDKQNILNEINQIFLWLNTNCYYDIDKKDYSDKIAFITNKFGILILQFDNLNNNILESSNSLDTIYNSANICDNEDDSEIINEINNTHTKLPIRESQNPKADLVNLCYSVYNVINNTNNLDDRDKIELQDYIDDVLLWSNINNDTDLDSFEYNTRITEINNFCNNIYTKYSNNNITINSNKKLELENLCLTIMFYCKQNTDIQQNSILYDKIFNIFNCIQSNNINSKNNSKNNYDNNSESLDDIYIKQIDEVNLLCNNISFT
jgi:molecular chaperone DnaK (HSP70)